MKLDLKKNNSFTRTLNVIMSWDDVKELIIQGINC